MTFGEFYQERLAAGLKDDAVNLSLCRAAWDTALCAASAACMDRGKTRDGHACIHAISDLHTWADPVPEPSPS